MSAIVENLLTVARAYAAEERVELSVVSKRAFSDSRRLAALAAGADITTTRAESAMQWLSDNWPRRAVWPRDQENRRIVRPQPKPEEPNDGTSSQAAGTNGADRKLWRGGRKRRGAGARPGGGADRHDPERGRAPGG